MLCCLQDVLGFLDLQDIVCSFMLTLDLPRLRSQSLAQCMADLEAAGRVFSARQLCDLEELGEAAPVCPALTTVLHQTIPVPPGDLAADEPQQVEPVRHGGLKQPCRGCNSPVCVNQRGR